MSRDLRQNTECTGQPRYLQLLALLAFHTFIKEGVGAAIFETHHGGEYDATNVIQKPIVTGITSLGMDHIEQLGPTIEDIAWHKAGIFKPGVPACSVLQEAGPGEVLQKRAAEKNTELTFVSAYRTLPANKRVLSVPVQRLNCSLALQLAARFLQFKNPNYALDANDISKGIDNFSWTGRFQVITIGSAQWYLDGAHNILSLEQAAEWFSTNVNAADVPRWVLPFVFTFDLLNSLHSRYPVLIFSHFSEERDAAALLKCLAHALLKHNAIPDHVIFTTYNERKDGSTRIGNYIKKAAVRYRANYFSDKTLKVPQTPFPDFCTIYSSLWKTMHPSATVSIESTIEGAIRLAEQISVQQGGMQVFVTGSLHLVGGALNILRP